MGLLDYLFEPNTYGGQGGLLSRLQPSIEQIPQSQGFPQQEQTAQAAPMQIGGYQMPRMGGADLYQPQQVMTPPNAAPTQGQVPQMAPQQAMQQPEQTQPTFMSPQQGSGGFGSAMRGIMANAHTGPIGAIMGGIAGATGMGQGTPLQQQQQNQLAQFHAIRQALTANGVSEAQAKSTAMLAVINPEAAKTILPELLTNREKYGVVSEDPFAGKKYGFINEREQTVNGKPLGAQTDAMGSGSPLADMEKAKAAGVQGEALYEYLPKQIAPMVKAMVEGRQPLPTGAAMRNPATLALIDAAHSVDPTFDATVWKARNEAGPDWSKGKSAEMVRSANQTLAHVGSLMDAMDKLHNRAMPAWNAAGNFVQEQFGAGEQGSFRTNAHAVAEEMSKVFKGANLSDAEIKHWEQNLSENMSPTQQKAQIAKLSELLHGSLQALEEKRLTAMGPAMAEKQGPLIKAEGQKVLDRIAKWTEGDAAAHTAQSSTPAAALPQGWSYKGSR